MRALTLFGRCSGCPGRRHWASRLLPTGFKIDRGDVIAGAAVRIADIVIAGLYRRQEEGQGHPSQRRPASAGRFNGHSEQTAWPLALTQGVGTESARCATAEVRSKFKDSAMAHPRPLATGMLPVASAGVKAVAGADALVATRCTTSVTFGVETNTLDREGKASVAIRCPRSAQVKAVLPRFTSPIEQVPPPIRRSRSMARRAPMIWRYRRGGIEAGRRSVVMRRFKSSPERGDRQRSRWGELSIGKKRCRGRPPLHQPAAGPPPSILFTCRRAFLSTSLARDIAHALGTVGHVTILRQGRKAGHVQSGSGDFAGQIGGMPLRAARCSPCHLRAGLDGISSIPSHPFQAR